MIVDQLLTELSLKDGHKLNLNDGTSAHVAEVISFQDHEAKVKDTNGRLYTIQKDGTVLDSASKSVGKTYPISV